MAGTTAATLNAVLKTQYTQKKVNLLTYKNNPWYAMIPKRTDFVGANKVVALRNGAPQGRGAAFGVGLGNISASVYNKFTVTRVSDYAFAQITTEAIRASKNDAGSLVDALKAEVDGAIYTCMRSLAVAMHRNGGGVRGQIASGQGTPTITLLVVTDVTNFEVGMVLNSSATDGTTGAKRTGTVTLTAIDRTLGTLTASGNWTAGITGCAANDFIFQNGDFEATNSMVKGLAGWLPLVAPTPGDNFFGLDRSSDVTRLSGVRYTAGSGGPIEEILIDTAALVVREGGAPDTAIMNPLDVASFVKALGTKVLYDRTKSFDEPDVGFKCVKVIGPMGDIDVVADVNCPKGLGYMLQKDTWCLESLGAAPGILDDDGNRILRDALTDSYIARIGYYGNTTCTAPGWNGVFLL